MTTDSKEQKLNAEKKKVGTVKQLEIKTKFLILKNKLKIYGIPFIFALIIYYPIIPYTASDLNDILNGIYSIYITISTIILSVSFIVISVLPLYFQSEKKDVEGAIAACGIVPMISTTECYPITSLNLLSSNHQMLVFSFFGLIISLTSYIFTAFNFLSESFLKLLFSITTFFVITSLFMLMFLTGELHKNLLRMVLGKKVIH